MRSAVKGFRLRSEAVRNLIWFCVQARPLRLLRPCWWLWWWLGLWLDVFQKWVFCMGGVTKMEYAARAR